VVTAKDDDAGGGSTRGIDLLWGEAGRPSRGPKPGLTVRRIALAAIAIADAEGLAAVSLQRVAGEVGVTTTALYRYLPGKTELINLMIDMGIGEPPDLDRMPGGWRPKLEEWARRLWAILHAHPWASQASAQVRPMGPNELGWLESAIGALTGTGLTAGELFDAAAVLSGHVRSMAQAQQQATGEQWEPAITRVLQKHGDRYPAMMAAIGSGALSPSDNDGLEFGLRCVLDGLGVLIAERAAEP
jgi:AcrR family transcriptional regulator